MGGVPRGGMGRHEKAWRRGELSGGVVGKKGVKKTQRWHKLVMQLGEFC